MSTVGRGAVSCIQLGRAGELALPPPAVPHPQHAINQTARPGTETRPAAHIESAPYTAVPAIIHQSVQFSEPQPGLWDGAGIDIVAWDNVSIAYCVALGFVCSAAMRAAVSTTEHITPSVERTTAAAIIMN